jgi:hypothetical protein
MIIVQNNLIPFKGFRAINLFGILFVRGSSSLSESTYLHERIHTRQMVELLYIGFYLAYLAEWLYLLCKYRNNSRAYRSISFEKEAYAHQYDGASYLNNRKLYAQWRKDV